jgi:ABC-2 type transport system ATP-binding protein
MSTGISESVLLQVNSVVKAYGKKVAVDNVSFTLKEGELVALLGENGAGKSTTLQLIMGLLTPDQGSIYCFGKRISPASVQAKWMIGYLTEQPFLYPTLSGREFLEFVGALYRIPFKQCQQRAEELLALLNLLDVAQQRIQSYSQGMKRRLALGSVLMHRPKVLLLDEPLNGLDPANVRDVKNLLQDLCKQGCCVLISTHLLDVAERLCSRAIILSHGHMVADGSLEQLRIEAKQMEQTTLETIFFALTGTTEHPEHSQAMGYNNHIHVPDQRGQQ